MSTETTSTTGANTAPASDVAVHVAGGEGPLSVADAARSVIDWRRKSAAGENEPKTNSGDNAAAADAPVEPAQESAQADAAPLETEATGETESQDAAAEKLPTIDPPRSWSKEKTAIWSTLDRATQEYLVEHDREVSKGVRNAQNEAAERARALQAEHAQVQQARAQYEQALPILLQNLQSTYSGEFADVRTMDDVQKLAVTDPIRYTQWDAAQKRMAAVQQEIVASSQRQMAERNQLLNAYRQREAELFAEKAPEFADPVQSKKLMDAAVTTLHDLGFQDQELGEMWRGERDISIHDHRLHLLLRDGIKWRDAQTQAKAKSAQAKPVPPVQRPGVAQGANAAREAQFKALNQQIDKSTGNNAIRAAAKLIAERRRAS